MGVLYQAELRWLVFVPPEARRKGLTSAEQVQVLQACSSVVEQDPFTAVYGASVDESLVARESCRAFGACEHSFLR